MGGAGFLWLLVWSEDSDVVRRGNYVALRYVRGVATGHSPDLRPLGPGEIEMILNYLC